jgi:hypothetical protein
MSKQNSHSTIRRLIILGTLTLLGLGGMTPLTRATEDVDRVATESHLMLAATERMDRRQERRDDRGDHREDRRDVRQNCREEEGMFGGEKRDCKQEGREERRDDDNDGDTDD